MESPKWYPHELNGMFAGNLDPDEYEHYLHSGEIRLSYEGVGGFLGLATLRPKRSVCQHRGEDGNGVSDAIRNS